MTIHYLAFDNRNDALAVLGFEGEIKGALMEGLTAIGLVADIGQIGSGKDYHINVKMLSDFALPEELLPYEVFPNFPKVGWL